MTDSPKQGNTGSRDNESECSQLTLDDWADALRAIPGTAETPARVPSRGAASAAAIPLKDLPSSRIEHGSTTTPHRLSATELLETPDALLSRTHLRELGLERRAI